YNFDFPAHVRVALSPGPDHVLPTCGPPNFCILDTYIEPGPHSGSWAGVDATGAFRPDIKQIGINGSRAIPQNTVVIFGTGTRPTMSTVSVTPTVFSPSAGSQNVTFTLSTYQNQAANITVTFLNQSSLSVLRTIQLTGQAPGNVSIPWDGRADNGMLVAPGYYTITVTATDGIGNRVTGQILTTVQY